MSEPATPPWLAGIQLVTFDLFGTLLDLPAALDKVELTGQADVATLDGLIRDQTERETWQRYSDILKQAIGQLRPGLRPAIVGVFAEDLGRTAPFADSVRALHSLREVVKVGLVGNCDAQHQVDALTALRVVPDVSITSQEIRAYKPTDRAWDAIVRMGVMRAAVTRDNWLHVSHSSRTDLVPARSKGIRTCQVLRAGHEERANSDLTVHSLDELVAMVVAAKCGPLLCEIDNVHPDAGERPRLAAWLLADMLPAVRSVAGVRSAALIERPDGTLVEQYVFGGQGEYDAYLEAFAAEHRANLRDVFGRTVERAVRLSRIRGRV